MIEKTNTESRLTVFGKIYMTAILVTVLLLGTSMFVPSIPVPLLMKVLGGLGIGFVAYLALKIVLSIWGIKLHLLLKKSDKGIFGFLSD